MYDVVFKNLGLVGTIIFVSAYLPQIIHLLRVKDSTGISVISWGIWLFGAVLLLVYAIHIKDIVFFLLTTLESISLLIVILLSLKYRK